jgi:peptidoglycan/xylan/chitin deacetylase (PgdA/CDA1 family)
MVRRLLLLVGSIIFFVVEQLKSLFQILIGKENSSTCVVFYYHSISTKERGRFVRQMDELLRWCKPVRLDMPCVFAERYRLAAVTFDDGFVSIVENALPELEIRNIPSAVFVPVSCLGQYPEWLSSPDRQKERILSAEELRKLDEKMVTIGSHCMSHRKLTELENDQAKDEIVKSKKELENILNRTVTLLSFPFGSFDSRHMTYAREAGYTHVLSISPALAQIDSGEYIIGRVKADPSDWQIEFRLKLLGCYRWFPWVLDLKSWVKRIVKRQSID